MGMHPVGFYDLRDAEPAPLPVVSTAFRPIDRRRAGAQPVPGVHLDAGARGPAVLRRRPAGAGAARSSARARCSRRSCWSWPTGRGRATACRRPTRGASSTWPRRRSRCRREPIDQAWYDELSAVSGGRRRHRRRDAARTSTTSPRGCWTSTSCTARMQARGIEMIDEIQGPPRWDGPDVLLRQTSFRALAEPRALRARGRRGRAGRAAGAVRRGRGARHRAHPGRTRTPSTRCRRSRRAWAAAVPATERGAGPGRAGVVHGRGVGGCTRSWPAAGRRPPDDVRGAGRRRLGPTSSRSSTRTSCRARRPASSAPTWPATAPHDADRGRASSATPSGWPAPSAVTCTTRWTCTPRRSTTSWAQVRAELGVAT